MSKRYSKSNPRPPMVIERGAGWYITFDVTSKEYSAYYSEGEYIASRATKDDAIDAIWARFDANAAEGSDDMDFSHDEATPAAQLAKEGLRLAGGDEAGWYAIVTEFGQTKRVWATDASTARPAPVRQFSSYAEAKGR